MSLGYNREPERDRLVLHESPRPEHRPGEDDVLTDRIGPAADCTQVARPVGRERSLSDERSVVRGLHTLHAVDPESVVPLLHAGDERRHRVFCDERGGARRYVLALRCAGNANHESCERLLLHMRVGMTVTTGVVTVARAAFSAWCLPCFASKPSVVESEALTRRVREQRGVVGRVVVRDDDLHPTLVGEFSDVFERADDRLALVPRRHEDRHRRPLAFGPVTLGRREREFLVARYQEREDHEPDHQAGDIGEEERNHPAHDGADRSLKLTSPWLGDPDAERHPRKRERECDREANRWPKPRSRSLAPCQTTQLSAWRAGVSRISSETAYRSRAVRRDSSWAASSKRRHEVVSVTPPKRAVRRR